MCYTPIVAKDVNGHVGEGNRGDENVMGRYGDKARNAEEQIVVDFATIMEMAVVNTYFKKREEHRVTYKSGGWSTQVDYIEGKPERDRRLQGDSGG